MADTSDTSVTVKSNLSLQTNSDGHSNSVHEEQNGKVFYTPLIADSTLHTIPPNLHTIITDLDTRNDTSSSRNKHDLIVSVFYVLMIETGFVPIDLPIASKQDIWWHSIEYHKQRTLQYDTLPAKWKNAEMNTYYLNFILAPIPYRVCKMICHVISQHINVNIIVDKACNVCAPFRVTKYVTCEQCEIVSMKFRHLDDLSREFKDHVSLVAKQTILNAEGYHNNSLQGLPSEVLVQIFKSLTVKDFLNLIRTCRRFKQCSQYFALDLWRHYFTRDFPNVTVRDNDDDNDNDDGDNKMWMDLYREEFRKRHRPRQFRSQSYYDYGFMDLI